MLARSEFKEEVLVAHFQSFWFGDVLPPCQTLCMKSFIDHGHEYDLYCYASPVVPRGVRVLDANEILSRREVFFYRRGRETGSVAGFANLFRYQLLAMRGGWWVDTDVLCLSSRIPEGETFLERENEDQICNAVMKFPSGHSFVKALCEKSREAGQDLEWGQTGPRLVSELAKQMGLWDQVEVQKHAYPIHWTEAYLPVTPSGRRAAYEKTQSAAFLHLWNEVFRLQGSVKLHNPPNGSLLAEIYKKHGVERRRWVLAGDNEQEHGRNGTRIFTRQLLRRLRMMVRARTSRIRRFF
jgi:hypothetical protein